MAFVTYVDAAQRVSAGERLYSNRASARLRVLIPARELAQRVPVWLVSPQALAEQPDLAQLGRPGAIVLGKLAARDVLQQKNTLLRVLEHAGGAALYADVSDDYAALGREMREPFLAQYQKALGKRAHLIVPCAAMGEALARHARRGITVIEDPYETAVARSVRVQASSPLRLAWFGSLGSVNVAPLERAFDAVLGSLEGRPVQLEMVTANESRSAVLGMRERLCQRHPGLEIFFSLWSLPMTEAAIERSDFVLLPQEHRTAWGRVKSHNRLVSVIRAGRLALASPIPAYQELAEYGWIGEDLAEGLRWALAHPDAAAKRVTAGQHYVEERFSPEAVGRKWAQAFGLC